jgi:hypothetical protein
VVGLRLQLELKVLAGLTAGLPGLQVVLEERAALILEAAVAVVAAYQLPQVI